MDDAAQPSNVIGIFDGIPLRRLLTQRTQLGRLIISAGTVVVLADLWAATRQRVEQYRASDLLNLNPVLQCSHVLITLFYLISGFSNGYCS